MSDEVVGGGCARWKLYDLVEDPGQSMNLAAQYPGIVAELVEEWSRDWR